MRKTVKMIAALLACVMLLSFAGCSAASGGSDELAALKEENARLKEENAALSARLSELGSTGFKSWRLDATAWGDSNGATVHFCAEPREYQNGQSVSLIVRLDGNEVISIPCSWDGSAFTADAELEAADGYSYTCVSVGADGSRDTMVLSSPDSPVYDTLVYLKSSLNAYCNLFVADWTEADGKLNITSGYVQVQLPQITATGDAVQFEGAQLAFQLNGNVIETQTLELPAGEGAGSYETALTSVSFNMPQMDDDYQLDLYLNVKLSGGESITTNGGSWYYNDGQLNMMVG